MKQQHNCVLHHVKVVFYLNLNRNEFGKTDDVTVCDYRLKTQP